MAVLRRGHKGGEPSAQHLHYHTAVTICYRHRHQRAPSAAGIPPVLAALVPPGHVPRRQTKMPSFEGPASSCWSSRREKCYRHHHRRRRAPSSEQAHFLPHSLSRSREAPGPLMTARKAPLRCPVRTTPPASPPAPPRSALCQRFRAAPQHRGYWAPSWPSAEVQRSGGATRLLLPPHHRANLSWPSRRSKHSITHAELT
jgi:hypothetical protein